MQIDFLFVIPSGSSWKYICNGNFCTWIFHFIINFIINFPSRYSNRNIYFYKTIEIIKLKVLIYVHHYKHYWLMVGKMYSFFYIHKFVATTFKSCRPHHHTHLNITTNKSYQLKSNSFVCFIRCKIPFHALIKSFRIIIILVKRRRRKVSAK